MGNALRKEPIISPEEYLAGEETSQEKHEYLAGAVYMMAGGSVGHSRISGNIFRSLGNQLGGKKCEAFSSDLMVRIQTDLGDFYYYPDVTVDCTARSNDSRFSDTPVVIFEVLSPSTERVDRHEKLLNYQRIATLEAYVLVDQSRLAVTLYRKTSEGWVTELFMENSDVLPLACIECQLPLSAIYDRTGLVGSSGH